MPQLRWTLLFLGVVFVILLAWIERRRQRQRFTDHAPAAEREHALDPLGGSSSAYREASLTLPEMRAREFSPPQDLPIVEIEEDSLNARRVEVGEPLLDPPTLSLPVLDSGPVKNRERTEPTMSATDWIKTSGSDDVPRLDIPAPKRSLNKIELAVAEHTLDETAEREFNAAVFGDAGLGPGNDTVSQSEIEAAAAEAEAYANQRQGLQQVQADQPQPPTGPGAASRGGAASTVPDAPAPDAFGESASADVGDTVERPRPPPFTPADVSPVVEPIVEWPPDDQRRVVALRLVAPPPDRLAGRALRLALASEGFVLGKFQIFHKPDDQGRAVLSAANLSKPGTFDVATMDVQRFGGLSLFIVLPGPKPPLKAFDELLSTARNLNERLQGALQDERGGPLTPTRIATLRESLGADATS
jgi:FtsZ-interacting cell division protein ZipA